MLLFKGSGVIWILLGLIYELNRDELRMLIDTLKFEQVVKLYAAADRYMLADVRRWAFQN